MSDLAIVAIPSQDDYVWKISSEKVPHLTLMMLGDSDNPEVGNIEEFLAHVVKSSMYRFGLDVDRRGSLGDNDADVLFFRKSNRIVENLEMIRHYLLTNQSIFKAYYSTDQFEEWTPHLTLGYPEKPAHKIERDYPISWVSFDRIALWTGDYEGPEFPLNDQLDDVLAMSVEDVDSLAHYGVKGMRWGVHTKDGRKIRVDGAAKSALGLPAATRKLKRDPTKAAAQTKAREAGGLHKLNDKELQALLNRMEMERKYKNFMNEESKRRSEGLKATGKILGEIGKVALPLVVSAAGAYAAGRMSNNGGSPFRTNATVGRVIDGVSKSTDLVRR